MMGKMHIDLAYFLKEDLGRDGDITTRFLIPKDKSLKAFIVAKEAGIVCGLKPARGIFNAVSPQIQVKLLAWDGQKVKKDRKIMEISGPRKILTAERTALNLLQHLSGVATLTHQFVERVWGTKAEIYDTRKTLPGLRKLQKYAVRCGGGVNHRMGLSDGILIKDNHLKAIAQDNLRMPDLQKKITALRKKHPRLPIEMEAQNLSQVRLALDCGADIILLDNMPIAVLKKAVALIRSHQSPITSHPLIEVSGGVTLKNVRSIAKLGVDRISIGRLTHSAPALDLSLELQ